MDNKGWYNDEAVAEVKYDDSDDVVAYPDMEDIGWYVVDAIELVKYKFNEDIGTYPDKDKMVA